MTRKEYKSLTAWYNRKAKKAAELLVAQMQGSQEVVKKSIENAFHIAEGTWNRLKLECTERGIVPIVQIEIIEATDPDGYNHMVFCPLVIGFRKA